MSHSVEQTAQPAPRLRKTVTFHAFIFCVMMVMLLWLIPSSAWRGTPPLHITLEFVAGLIALVTAAGSMVRFIALEHRRILFFGLSFLGAGIADMYHGVIAIQSIMGNAGTDPTSWTAGRDTHAFLLIASLIIGRYAPKGRSIRLEIALSVIGVVLFTGLMLLSLDGYLIALLSYNVYPFGWLSQWPSIVLFMISGWTYWRLFVAQRSVYFDWAAASIFILCVVQVYAALNVEVNDIHFYVEHVLKDIAYLVALCGLFLESLNLFRRLEQERRANARYHTVIEAASDNVIVADTTGTIMLANRSAHELLGYESGKLIGLSISAIMPERFRDAHHAGFKRYLDTRAAKVMGQPLDLWALRKDSAEVPVELFLSASGAGEAEQFIAIFRDVTERKKTEEEIRRARDLAEDANRAKSEFLASMSHEIRTPMNGMIGMLGLLLDTSLDTEQREYTQIARSSADTLLMIINDILDFSKIEAGKLEIEPVPFDLRMAVEEVADMLAAMAEDKGIALIVRYDPDAPTRIVGDPGRIRQVLINLTSNAIKFTRAGHVLIGVDKESDSDGEAIFRLSVEDTGIGVPEEKLDRIFEKFAQADASTTRKYGGTGLGLAISCHLIELMGGEIGVTSKVGEGSTFWFRLSLPLDAAAPPLPQADIINARVIIVDDHEVNRRVLAELMTKWQIRYESVASGEEALDTLRTAQAHEDPFHIMLLDYHMPDMDGGMLGRIVKADPALEKTILIMISSIGYRREVDGFNPSDFAAYLAKPIRQSRLLDTMIEVWEASAGDRNDSKAKRRATEEPRLSESVASQDSKIFPGARILIAEDNIVNQKVAVRILEKLGCRVDVAANGQEAVEMLKILPYDLVFMDCQMPEMDGFEATAAIRRLSDRVGRTPIIAMTANALQGDRERCLEAGMDDYISKPVAAEDFETMLQRWTTLAETAPAGEKSSSDTSPGVRNTSVASQNIVETDTPALDPEVIASLEAIDEDGTFLSELFEEFRHGAKTSLSTMRQAIITGDRDALKAAAHSLKGAGRNIGANTLGKLCHHLEKLDMTHSLAEAPEIIHKIETELDRVQQAIDAL